MFSCLTTGKEPGRFNVFLFLGNDKGQENTGIHHKLHRRPPSKSATAPSPKTGPRMDSRKADSFSIHS